MIKLIMRVLIGERNVLNHDQMLIIELGKIKIDDIWGFVRIRIGRT